MKNMKATDFDNRRSVMYPHQVNRVGFQSIKVLEFLNGRPWDDIALGFVHALRPYAIRIVRDCETCDAQTWRVTVYVDADNLITKIRQEVEVWLPEAVENGYELRRALAKEAE